MGSCRLGSFPRLKIWNMQQIRNTSKLDKLVTGDYGRLEVLDAAYGEQHPREAQDSVAPEGEFDVSVVDATNCYCCDCCADALWVKYCFYFVAKMVAEPAISKSKVRERRGRTLKLIENCHKQCYHLSLDCSCLALIYKNLFNINCSIILERKTFIYIHDILTIYFLMSMFKCYALYNMEFD
ncbi:uncharacterized protein LOC110738495 [Chenopodium quinoa]|uniref:uncharacterized protein LOC110738495 n=1 Tax=Chenopodium quinoa TaxID=63459 RepID=UPI000B7887E1|nr:uncharacterized protein LOC110738495 [Chenopodium quinoa]